MTIKFEGKVKLSYLAAGSRNCNPPKGDAVSVFGRDDFWEADTLP
jgi:hypothetical protein